MSDETHAPADTAGMFVMELRKLIRAEGGAGDQINAKITSAVDQAIAAVTANLDNQIGTTADVRMIDNLAAAASMGADNPWHTAFKCVVERFAPKPEAKATTLIVQTPEGLKLGQVQGEKLPPQFDEIATTVAAGLNVLLVGPAGAGKTTISKLLGMALGLECGYTNCSGGMTEGDIVGRLIPTGQNGTMEYVPSEFVISFTTGRLHTMEEFDAGDENVLLKANSAVANGFMVIPHPDPAKRLITRHPNFRLVANANTWGSGANAVYCGRNQLDAATIDRFAGGVFQVDYNTDLELAIGEPMLVLWAWQVRKAVRDHGIRRVVSTRLIVNGTIRLKAGATLRQVQDSFFLPWSDAEIAKVDPNYTRPKRVA